MNNDYEFQMVIMNVIEEPLCEIHFKDEVLAKIFPVKGELMIEIYASIKEDWWILPLTKFKKVLEESKIALKYIVECRNKVGLVVSITNGIIYL